MPGGDDLKIISIANQKGGCGKTTLAVNIAAALSRLGSETLLIDLDPQAHATFALGYDSRASEVKTSYDIFKSRFDETEIAFEDLVVTERKRLSFIPSNMMLSAVEINLGNVNGAAAILSNTLSADFFNKYDYVIIDSPPSFGFLTLNSMYAADVILVPMDLSYFSFNGINGVYRVTGLLNSETGRDPSIFFIMNIYDKRSNFAKQFEADARNRLGANLLPTKIRSSVRLREAAKAGKTIFEYDPKCPSSLDFYNITSDMLMAQTSDLDTVVKEFVLHAPEAGSVYILGDFNGWQKSEANRLAKVENGAWSSHFTLNKGKYRYKFLVDNEWIRDPQNSHAETNIFGTVDSILTL